MNYTLLDNDADTGKLLFEMYNWDFIVKFKHEKGTAFDVKIYLTPDGKEVEEWGSPLENILDNKIIKTANNYADDAADEIKKAVDQENDQRKSDLI